MTESATTVLRATASAISTLAGTRDAVMAACEDVKAGLGDGPIDLCLFTLSVPHVQNADWALSLVQEYLAPGTLLGCSVSGVIAGGHEVEDGPAVGLWAARLPEARGRIHPFHLSVDDEDGRLAVDGLPDGLDLGVGASAPPVLLIADPYTFPTDPALALANRELGGLRIVGGLASGASGPGRQALFCDGEIHDRGAVGAVFEAGVDMVTAVSQGCAPVGPDMVVTAADGPLVIELAGVPAVAKLREVLDGLEPRERALVRSGLLLGVVIDENQPEYARGDYLMRPVSMVDPRTDAPDGALFVGASVRVGQTVRFQARDATSADEDLRAALAEVTADGRRPLGSLLFSCTGRGRGLFGSADHDVRRVDAGLGGPATSGGFFCAGEIGPVGGRNFLHGFTATMAVFLAPR